MHLPAAEGTQLHLQMKERMVDAMHNVFNLKILSNGLFAVTAIDISYDRLKLLRHNARIYGIGEEKISIIQGDFVNLAKNHRLKADIVFLSPPWYETRNLFLLHHCL